MFEREVFLDGCKAALAAGEGPRAIRALVARAVADPDSLIAALGAPSQAGMETLYRAADLTVLTVAWAPGTAFPPHDHRMWAVIGVYQGREDNSFFRREGAGIVAAGKTELHGGDTLAMNAQTIHAVRNPLDRITAALHVYGGDFFATRRSEWETGAERPYDLTRTLERLTGA